MSKLELSDCLVKINGFARTTVTDVCSGEVKYVYYPTEVIVGQTFLVLFTVLSIFSLIYLVRSLVRYQE